MTYEEVAVLNTKNLIRSIDFMLEMSSKGIHLHDLGFGDAIDNYMRTKIYNDDGYSLTIDYVYCENPFIRVKIKQPNTGFESVVCSIYTSYRDSRYELNNSVLFNKSTKSSTITVENDSNHFHSTYIDSNGNHHQSKINLADEAEVFQYSLVGEVPDYLFDIGHEMKKLLHKSCYVNRIAINYGTVNLDLCIRDLRAEYDARRSSKT